jgi:ATP-binding cassette, subfamily C (CFTR/MRP), member 1
LVLDLTVAGLTVVLMILVVKLRATINPGFVGLALVNVNGFNLSLTELIKAWTLLETSMGAISRVKSFSTETVAENLPTENEVVPANLKWPSKGNIEITNLWAGYKPDVPVVKDITLYIPAGEKVGICGPSGSGKSSIIATLFRMLEISSGSITVDGLDISRLPRQDVRMHINAIPQDAYFFKGTVRTNIDPLSRCSDDHLKAALAKAKLWSVVESKGGLDAPAEAEMFSHGQRQLFCLARAILHPSKIVVLDEVTSSVDLATDELMQQVIREEFGECTILAVAHRLDTIMDFDRIAVLKAGKLVEFDTPKALMSRDSAFKALYESG